jgi:cytochrome c
MRTTVILALLAAIGGAMILAVAAPGRATDEEDSAAKAAEALKKAVDEGNRLFRDPALGTSGKFCATCHEDAQKPKLALSSRVGDYPKWDRRADAVITLGQKVRQMIEKNVKGSPPDLGSAPLVALEAYLMSLRAR